MRHLILGLAFMLLLGEGVFAFEIDGLRSGMSLDQATKAMESLSYEKIEIRENSVMAYDKSTEGGRLISATFCKGKLVQAQKHLQPRFDHFVRLVEQKTKDLGRPTAAWTRPADVESRIISNSVSFLWHDGPTSVTVSYTEFPSTRQLDIVYEIKNSCWQVP